MLTSRCTGDPSGQRCDWLSTAMPIGSAKSCQCLLKGSQPFLTFLLAGRSKLICLTRCLHKKLKEAA